MSQAYFHEGLVIEPLDNKALRIEGCWIDVQNRGGWFVYKERPEIRAETLEQLGKKIIDSWRQIKDNREDIKEKHLKILNKGVKAWNRWRRRNPTIRPILYRADLSGRDFCSEEPVDFSNTNLIEANLSHAVLDGVNFHEANLAQANLSHAQLKGAHFCRTDLYQTNLSHAVLHGANLQGTQMAMTDLTGAKLEQCKIYGMSAWDLKMKGAKQKSFQIVYTKRKRNGKTEESLIEVDDLRVAQFVYLLLHNENIRYVIDTVTPKAVLILGRFTPERKAVLDLVRRELCKHEYVPILFDFNKPKSEALLETVMTLAGMVRFVVADATDATMVREELRSIVEKFPSKPVQPILLRGEKEYVTLREIKRGFKSVLPVSHYSDKKDLTERLQEIVINPAEAWLEAKKKRTPDDKTVKEIALEKENAVLEKEKMAWEKEKKEMQKKIEALKKRKKD